MKQTIISMTLALATLDCDGISDARSDFGDGNVQVSIEQGGEWFSIITRSGSLMGWVNICHKKIYHNCDQVGTSV